MALRPLGLGDLLTAVPALRALQSAFPDHHRLLATSATWTPLVELIGAVHEVWPAEPHRPLHLPRPPDVAVDLHGRGPRSHSVLLGERPRRLVAFAHAQVPESAGGAPWREGEHEISRWCRMLTAAGIPANVDDLDLRVPAGHAVHPVAGATLLHPGAGSAGRRWPITRFAAVARHECAVGRRVVITAGPGELQLACRVAESAGLDTDSIIDTGTDLLELVAVVAAAGRVVCGDTGIAHLATALRTPSVVLFGPTPPSLWGPPQSRTRHIALWKGRRGDPHAFAIDPGLLEIGVDEVVTALERLPAAAAT